MACLLCETWLRLWVNGAVWVVLSVRTVGNASHVESACSMNDVKTRVPGVHATVQALTNQSNHRSGNQRWQSAILRYTFDTAW